ncbi:hypothetical protein GGR56DRAFT_677272 [Xylariaceae sp. FL0804]|nr:hypothetical protein GGR56DRAFT_677272 [Xylariaceae sp. FL0804]
MPVTIGERPTGLVTDLGMKRRIHNELSYHREMISFLGFGGSARNDWTHASIVPYEASSDSSENDDDPNLYVGTATSFCCEYSVAPRLGVYIVHAVNLEDFEDGEQPPLLPDSGRRVRHRELIVDNYRAVYDGPLSNLHVVAYANCTGEDHFDAVEKVMGARRDAGMMDPPSRRTPEEFVVYPDGCGWYELVENSPLINGLIKLLEENRQEIGNKAISRVVIMHAASDRPYGVRPGLYMTAYLMDTD